MRMKYLGVVGLIVLLVAVQARAYYVDFNDGGYHIIDYVIDGGVYVDYDTPDAGTQIEVVSGGWITGNISARGISTVIINGGTVGQILTYPGSASIVVHSGVVSGINASSHSQVKIFGGQILGALSVGAEATATISGGDIGHLSGYGYGSIYMDGGQVDGLISLSSRCLLTLAGTSFEVNGYSVGYGDYASTWATPGIDPFGYPWLTGTLTGILENNDTVNNEFRLRSGGDITFVPEPVEAEIDIEPDTLNLKSKGKWLTCYIWLPEDYNVNDIEPNSIRLEAEPNDIYPDWLWFEEYEQVAMAKFKRSEPQEALEPGDIELIVTGYLNDGSYFIGTDTIKVIDKGHKEK